MYRSKQNLRHLRQVLDNDYPPQMSSSQEGTRSSSNRQTRNLLEILARQRRATAESQNVFDEIYSYLAEAVVDTSADALLRWKYIKKRFPRLARMDQEYLDIQATYIPSEQLFASFGDTSTKKRARLSPITVEAVECVSPWVENRFGFRSTKKYGILAKHIANEPVDVWVDEEVHLELEDASNDAAWL
ncbi:hypothetical protein PsorP6_015643 [Peronosclerospora sorghi]|uniref:Uncharacterized protein n=1 Tax=Peronosclerospora sorghi TaxID=230839 RepID=A0ACC0WNF8_9STRA|nr:hypothetical protein PsorP6_015643 [Peronosclerospora sorghi]